MNRLRTVLGRFLLNEHMPVLLTAFFWLVFLCNRFLDLQTPTYLFLAWPLTVELWLIAAVWKRRELIRSISYFIYFWVFQSLIMFVVLNRLNRAFRIVDEKTLAALCDVVTWLMLLFLIALRHRLLTGRRMSLLPLALLAVFLFAYDISLAFGKADLFIRKAVFASVLTRDNPTNTIIHFTTPTRMVALVADPPDEKPRTIRVYSLAIPNALPSEADTMINIIDAAGANSNDEDRQQSSTRLRWIALDEYRLSDGHIPPVSVLYREWHNRTKKMGNKPDFSRSVLISSCLSETNDAAPPRRKNAPKF